MYKRVWNTPRKLKLRGDIAAAATGAEHKGSRIGIVNAFYAFIGIIAAAYTIKRAPKWLITLLLIPGIPVIAMMAWTAPTTRSTGDLITATIWNTDLVDNLQYLHDRAETIWAWPDTPAAGVMGDYAVRSRGVGNSASISFCVPDDFDAIIGIEIALAQTNSGNLQYDLESDYCNPDSSELYNVHSESSLNQTVAVTANKPIFLSAAGVFTALAAGDICGLTITNDGVGGAGSMYVVGLRFTYTLD